jgi:hypothetical protein
MFADERNLAGAVSDVALRRGPERVEVRCEIGVSVRTQQWCNAAHRVGRSRHESLRQELSPRDRTRMIGVKERQVEVALVSFHGHLK